MQKIAIIATLIFSTLVIPVCISPTAVGADITPDEVNRAIDQGVAYLRRQQLPDGSWEEYTNQTGGITSLCTLALLNAGIKPSDPSIQKALNMLRQLKPKWTYAASLRIMVFSIASPERDRALIRQHVQWLEATQIKQGPTSGMWAYPVGSGDNSNSQFALLALYEAERAGVQADLATWTRAKNYWQTNQNTDGSWGYYPKVRKTGEDYGTGSMTCAGIGSLSIIDGAISKQYARVDGDRVVCCQDPKQQRGQVERGLQWLGKNFQVSNNPGMGKRYQLYYLYGMERVGRLTARRFIGDHDWYREGTQHLLKSKGQMNDHWKGYKDPETNTLIATSYALLFLTKGRRPVLMAKLEYGNTESGTQSAGSESWNAHPKDVNNMTRFVESRWDMDLTWQVVGLEQASVDDLLQSPVLYLCGGDASPLPESESAQKELAQKLREYLEQGGFLFVDAYMGGGTFDLGFRKLMRMVMPEPEYRLQLLDRDHPVWSAEVSVNPRYLRPLEGIDFGCRTSVIYSPPIKVNASGGGLPFRPSLSCLWEVSRPPRGATYPDVAQDRVNAGLAIGINVLAYATGRELRTKDAVPTDRNNATAQQGFTRGKIYIANLQHPGGCNAAPRALLNLMRQAAEELELPTGMEERRVSPTDPGLFDYHLIFMHGRSTFRLSDAEQRQLVEYIDRGGILFVNAICASRAFSESFRREVKTMFPEDQLQAIPLSDPMFTKTYSGFDLSSVTMRVPQPRTGGRRMEVALKKGPPQLEGIKIDGRWAVIFSKFDISCALERQNSLECQGYTKEDAARIGLNVILYSLEE